MLLGRRQRGQPARHQRVDQPPLHHGRNHGQLLQRILGGRVQATHPAQHRVDDRGRDAVALPGGEHLGDEKRIPGGQGEHSAGVDPAGRAQPPDRVLRQAPQRQPADPARGRRLPEELLEGMLSGQLVVAVGQHQHGRQARRSGGPGSPTRPGWPRRPSARPPPPGRSGARPSPARPATRPALRPARRPPPAPGSARRRPGRPGPGTAPGSAGCPGRRSGRPADAPRPAAAPGPPGPGSTCRCRPRRRRAPAHPRRPPPRGRPGRARRARARVREAPTLPHREYCRRLDARPRSICSAPDGSGLLTLDASSIQTDPDGIPSDRLDDQAGQAARLVEHNWRLVLNPQAIDREVKRHGNAS